MNAIRNLETLDWKDTDAKNRFNDLPKNISAEGWREETTNPQEPAREKKKNRTWFFYFLVLYVNLTDR